MSNKGWISLHRKIKDNWLWQRKRVFSEFEAWIDILLSVNHAPAKVSINGQLIEVKEGEILTSILKLSEAWQWSRGKVTRFLDKLESEQMINQKRTSKYTLLTVMNWALYQDENIENRHQTNIKRTSNEHQIDNKQTSNGHQTDNRRTQTIINNNENNVDNVNNDNNENKKPYDDFFERIWKLYPKKQGKNAVKEASKEELAQYSYEEIARAIERYYEEIKDKDVQYWMYGSTFFNGRYKDYLDANYQPPIDPQKLKWAKWEKMQDDLETLNIDYRRLAIPRDGCLEGDIDHYKHYVEARWEYFYNKKGEMI